MTKDAAQGAAGKKDRTRTTGAADGRFFVLVHRGQGRLWRSPALAIAIGGTGAVAVAAARAKGTVGGVINMKIQSNRLQKFILPRLPEIIYIFFAKNAVKWGQKRGDMGDYQRKTASGARSDCPSGL